MKFKGKKVWVLGGTGVIGSAINEAFDKEGADVLYGRVDITNFQSLIKTTNSCSPDIVINCTGKMGPIAPAVFCDRDEWMHAINVNLIGAVNLTQAVIPTMLAKGGGKIIHFGGGGASNGWPYHSAYAVSKTGLVRFVETVAEEIASMNIQINAIAPGPVKSPMNPNATGTPDKAVELALFLASEESGDLTGRLISAVHDDWKNFNNRHTILLDTGGKLRRVCFDGEWR